ncbi:MULTISPECIES: gluconate 2-dehydrogenase subunit 3 family protein [unclassified Neptuniibacter]|uniref:gluconate 2-dehydrogenase subunit 3 family protein n=1 Tax=unclassified Neptuniibacter TaxID=2630693 RepID=UPI000C44AC72|nr:MULTISPECIES: gluconate 2-dehydrogenase subunit 3 family protein [unclassified Neptuniibacter]MAY42794.1 Twin-arginine translocation pathway signal [Oceanospirillaceae bacterium]
MNKNKKSLFSFGKSVNSNADEPCVNRREFLSKTGKIALGASAVVIGGGLFSPESFAAKKIGIHGNATLLKMARDIYPHDTLENKYYVKVMSPMSEAAEKDSDLFKLLAEGVESLDTISVEKFDLKYVDIKSESDRVVVLKSLEASPFFQKIKGALMMGIYNNPELWPRFGFGGSAWEKGGYINRGYDKNDWI